jgi:hypothetical protein
MEQSGFGQTISAFLTVLSPGRTAKFGFIFELIRAGDSDKKMLKSIDLETLKLYFVP